MRAHVIIASRGGLQAKSRLAPSLGASDREALVEAMLADMLAVFRGRADVDSLSVVTPTPRLIRLAERAGARAIVQFGEGLNEAFAQARRTLTAEGPRAMLLLPGDLPRLQVTDVEACLSGAGQGRVVIAPTADGGTGALAIEAAAAFPFRFGPGSGARHVSAAHSCGLEARVISTPGLSFDLDRPEDLALVRTGPAGSRTTALLRRWRAAA